MTGVIADDLVLRCRECRRPIRVQGGGFVDRAAMRRHITETIAAHGMDYVADHPSLLAQVDQDEAAERDAVGATS